MKVGVLGNGGTSVFDRFSFRISFCQLTKYMCWEQLSIFIVRECANKTLPGFCFPAASNGLLPAESSGDF